MKLSATVRGFFAGSVLLAAPYATAGAQTASFNDGSFASGWTFATVVNPYACSGGSNFTAPSGGNPGSYLYFTNYSCGLVVNAHVSPFSWNPSSQGAITHFAFASDITNHQDGDIAFVTLVRQNNNYFINGYALAHGGDGWTDFSNADVSLDNSDWCNVFQGWGGYNDYTCGSAQLDFSSTGGQIDFGIASANSGGYPYSREGGIDNFDIQLDHDPAPVTAAPEPASIVLMASGLVAVAAFGRRRAKKLQRA